MPPSRRGRSPLSRPGSCKTRWPSSPRSGRPAWRLPGVTRRRPPPDRRIRGPAGPPACGPMRAGRTCPRPISAPQANPWVRRPHSPGRRRRRPRGARAAPGRPRLPGPVRGRRPRTMTRPRRRARRPPCRLLFSRGLTPPANRPFPTSLRRGTPSPGDMPRHRARLRGSPTFPKTARPGHRSPGARPRPAMSSRGLRPHPGSTGPAPSIRRRPLPVGRAGPCGPRPPVRPLPLPRPVWRPPRSRCRRSPIRRCPMMTSRTFPHSRPV